MSNLGLFLYGVGCALVVGLLVTTVELDALPRRGLAFLIASGFIAWCVAGYRWLRTKPWQRPSGQCVLVIVGLGLLAIPGGIFAIYASWWESAGELCKESRWGDTREKRERGLDRARTYIDRLSLFDQHHIECDDAKRELGQLEGQRVCPMVLSPSIPCSCAGDPWPKELSCGDGQYAACAVSYGDDGNSPTKTKVIFCRDGRLTF